MSLTITGDIKKNGRMVLNYRSETVLKKYCIEYNVSREDAELLFIEMLKFLYLCSISDRPLSPSKDIDKIWHIFILCTKDYAKFCDENLDQFIHHNPDVDLSEKSKSFNTSAYSYACELGYEVFGDMPTFAWPIAKKTLQSVDCGSSCGGCHSCSSDCFGCNNE